ncbi:MAG TPA: FAD-binding oxidoreductase [Ilumatobacteraceae bacterium]|nr:FAD-binding oxidoreductase [Ilumatobacteraceae bacterium]
MTEPVPPIELTGTAARFAGLATRVQLDDSVLAHLAAICETVTSEAATAEASRDWWPLAMHWSLAGMVPQRAAAVCRPTSTDGVAAILRECSAAGVPVTAAGGRSGVSGASVPAFGGVVLDLTAMQGIVAVDAPAGVVEVLAGTFGPQLEAELRDGWAMTIGHFPQSFDIATVGGWVACRGAGQYSTRYGKIEHIVAGLEAVLADGTVLRSGRGPAAAMGPDLTQLFVGSEGTLGVITRVWLRARPVPTHERRAAYAFGDFVSGIEACRLILRRGATPAVLRLYDKTETQRSHSGDGSQCALLVLDEGDIGLVEATFGVVEDECAAALPASSELVDSWLAHRNDTSALQDLTRRGLVVDTMEIAAPWSRLPAIYSETCAALMTVPHARTASCHLSHSYLDGACLYFTFAASPPPEEIESTYVAMWDAGQRAVLGAGGNLSHHHGIGLNRARFMAEAMGPSLATLQAVKDALDPQGILNPGKLGLSSPFGSVRWP